MKVLSVFGTRPEAIKMAPVVAALEASDAIEARVCVTAQHREMLDQVLSLFKIKPDYDLNLMRSNQTLTSVTAMILERMEAVLDDFKPDWVLVHGDTTTTMAVTLACFYKKIAVGHVEAGLRTGNIYSPWPEEANRKLTSLLARVHFAPTEISKNNLIKETVRPEHIHVTGNTVIDALLTVADNVETDPDSRRWLDEKFNFLDNNKKLILVTIHRRENLEGNIENICEAIRQFAIANDDVEFICPVHLNPKVQTAFKAILDKQSNVFLIEPQDYLPFVYLMNRSFAILSDSGGIQEEAPALGKPVLVLRETTERPEAVAANTVKLVGANVETIKAELKRLLVDNDHYKSMANAENPYGDGSAAKKIVAILEGALK